MLLCECSAGSVVCREKEAAVGAKNLPISAPRENPATGVESSFATTSNGSLL